MPLICDGADVEHAKPAPDLLLKAAHLLGVEPAETWYVGDSRWDMVASKAAGMRAIAVLTGATDEAELQRVRRRRHLPHAARAHGRPAGRLTRRGLARWLSSPARMSAASPTEARTSGGELASTPVAGVVRERVQPCLDVLHLGELPLAKLRERTCVRPRPRPPGHPRGAQGTTVPPSPTPARSHRSRQGRRAASQRLPPASARSRRPGNPRPRGSPRGCAWPRGTRRRARARGAVRPAVSAGRCRRPRHRRCPRCRPPRPPARDARRSRPLR